MTLSEALRLVNEDLAISAGITHRGDELKCWVPDPDEGGLTERYLSADDCVRLSTAFISLSMTLRAAPLAGTVQEGKDQ